MIIRSEEVRKGEIINISTKELVLNLPRLNGEEFPAKLNWIQSLEDDYFLAGLTYFESPRAEGHTLWVIKLDEEKGFIPIVCALHYT